MSLDLGWGTGIKESASPCCGERRPTSNWWIGDFPRFALARGMAC